MLDIHYFASIREALNKDHERVALPSGDNSVANLISQLQSGDPAFKALFSENNRVLVAVNQTVVDQSHRLSEGDEVAFFPPMTGG